MVFVFPFKINLYTVHLECSLYHDSWLEFPLNILGNILIDDFHTLSTENKPHLHSVKDASVFTCVYSSTWPSTEGKCYKDAKKRKMFNLSCSQNVKKPYAYIAVQEDHKNFHQGELALFQNNPFIPLRAKKDNMPKLHLRSIYRNTVALCPLFFQTTP